MAASERGGSSSQGVEQSPGRDEQKKVRLPLPAADAAATGGGDGGAVVTAAPDSPAGEVRLLVGKADPPHPAAAAAGGGSSHDANSNGPFSSSSSKAARGSTLDPDPALQSASSTEQQRRQAVWQESMALADAATQAAMAAAELARSEVEAAHPVQHRVGLLRFMRMREQPSHAPSLELQPESAHWLQPPAAATAADAAAADDTGGGWRLRQAVGAAAAGKGVAAAPAAAGMQPSQPPAAAAAGGMGQLVADLLAAQGKEMPQSSSGVSGSRVVGEGSGVSGCGAGVEKSRADVAERLLRKLQRRGMAGDSWHARWVVCRGGACLAAGWVGVSADAAARIDVHVETGEQGHGIVV